MERQQRAARIHRATFDLKSLPQVRVPYRLWRSPALDFVVSGGATYRAADGLRVDRQTSVYAAGEIARLSYDAQLTTNRKAKPNLLRVRAFRSDPDGGLLGPLKATHFGVGDVESFDSALAGAAGAGRGAVSPTGRWPHAPPSTAPASKAICPPAGKRSCIATASCSASPSPREHAATSSRTCSCSMAKTASGSCSMDRKGRSRSAKMCSMSAKTIFRPARPGIGPAPISPPAT
jgi:hypothetical protein